MEIKENMEDREDKKEYYCLRCGFVGNDGETHQGVFDLSFLNTIPNLVVMAPKDFKEQEV